MYTHMYYCIYIYIYIRMCICLSIYLSLSLSIYIYISSLFSSRQLSRVRRACKSEIWASLLLARSLQSADRFVWKLIFIGSLWAPGHTRLFGYQPPFLHHDTQRWHRTFSGSTSKWHHKNSRCSTHSRVHATVIVASVLDLNVCHQCS